MSDHRTCSEMHNVDRLPNGNQQVMLLGYILSENSNRQTLQSMFELGWIDINTLRQSLGAVNWHDPKMLKNILEITEVLAINFNINDAFDVLKDFYNRVLLNLESVQSSENPPRSISEVSAKLRVSNPALYILIQSYFEERSESFGLGALQLLSITESLEI